MNKFIITFIIMQNKIIIHISGAQGSGKSTMGNILSQEFKENIIVKDLDDLHVDFYKQTEIQNYQQFIYNFTEKYNKPIIFTGLSSEMCLGNMDENNNTFYKIPTKYKYYIDMDDNDILKQRFFRQTTKLMERKEWFFDSWLKNPNEIQKKLLRVINLSEWKENNKKCKDIHKKYNYIFMDQQNILEKIKKILHKQNK